jgi:hypothetical protein
MSFLTPLFLVGLGALAIPVILHLIQRERRNVVQFPSLMFIRRIPYQSVQRRRIRHWLLLALRLAALTLLVLAFGRPFFRRTEAASAGGSGAREVVVLVDRSYSMGYGDRWQKALAAARSAVGGLKPSDRGSVVFFSSNAEVAVRSTSDKSRLQASLTTPQPGAGATRYGPALKLAGSVLSESALPRREAILISDFQRIGWQGAEGVRLPDGAQLTPVSVAEPDPENLSVTPVALSRSTFSNQQRVSVTAGVVNHGTAPVSGVDVTLEVGGRGVQTVKTTVQPGGSSSVTFDPVTVAQRNQRASVRLAADKLEKDNVFNFVMSPDEPVRVLLLERPGAPRDDSLFLSRALAVGDAPRFEVTSRNVDGTSPEDLSRSAVVVLNDVPINSATADRLVRFVNGGGGLLVVAGPRAAWAGPADVLPGPLGNVVDRTSGAPVRLGAIEYGHPALDVFRAPRSGDFAAAHFYSYRAVSASPGSQVLARYDDGGPALLERKTGAGRVLLWTSSIDTSWNDMAVRPVYLPLMHRLLRYLGDYREPAPWRTVGEVLDAPVTAPSAKATSSRVALTPSGQRVALDGEGPEVLELTEQGFYEIRAQGRDAEPAAVVASNVDLAESDMTPIDPAEVSAAATGHAGGTGENAATTPPSDDAQEGAQRIWWYLMFAGLLFLTAETVVGNRSTI